jgi:shikimate kinase/3-dehydroquinate synthase
MATRPAIALIGFMAAGKSRAGAGLARELGEPHRDTDELIEAGLGEPISAFFEREGEAEFRRVEEEAVLEALDAGGIVSLGGGALGSDRVRRALGECLVVLCRVRESVAWKRARGTGRPLAGDRGAFKRLFEERAPIYEAAADVVLPRVGTETIERVAPWIAALRDRRGLKLAWAKAASAEYPVIVGRGATSLVGSERPEGLPLPGVRLFPVVDPAAVGSGAVTIPVGCEEPLNALGGEANKTLAEAERLIGELVDRGVRRDDAIVAVGGGVVGDLAGFVAAVYQRGVPVVQIPTTLVAQVDSALGGKTGVDIAAAKNYVGAYHQPAAVLADPKALEGLPAPELAAGYAEVVKTALIAGGDLWERVRSLGPPTAASMADVVFDCAQTKLTVVAEDERDAGRRAVLNLGHTVGHAIESATGYASYRHGEAVALGMLAALRLSGQDELRSEVTGLWEGAGLPTSLAAAPELTTDAIVAATGLDKKRTAGGLGFVLVREPGDVVHGEPVADADLRAAVEELRPS